MTSGYVVFRSVTTKSVSGASRLGELNNCAVALIDETLTVACLNLDGEIMDTEGLLSTCRRVGVVNVCFRDFMTNVGDGGDDRGRECEGGGSCGGNSNMGSTGGGSDRRGLLLSKKDMLDARACGSVTTGQYSRRNQ